jgi:uroporphyrinogen-III synthase
MSQRLLITRAEDDAQHTAQKVGELGYATLIDSMLRIHPQEWKEPEWNKISAIIVTSPNVACGLEGRQLPREKFFFPVGARATQMLRNRGFIHVTGAVEKSDDLPYSIRMQIRPEEGSLLHLTSKHAHDAFYDVLRKQGYKIAVRHVYHAEESRKLQEATVQALQKGEIGGVLFYSARTATIFQDLCRRQKVAENLRSVCALGLSPAVAAACDKKLWKSIHAAEAPTHPSLMDCLAKVMVPAT